MDGGEEDNNRFAKMEKQIAHITELMTKLMENSTFQTFQQPSTSSTKKKNSKVEREEKEEEEEDEDKEFESSFNIKGKKSFKVDVKIDMPTYDGEKRWEFRWRQGFVSHKAMDFMELVSETTTVLSSAGMKVSLVANAVDFVAVAFAPSIVKS
ncbi:hypothetical protein LWI29_038094 [Acer saccharum]|uniref:Uncharacterized protein n=1 Tax=Acer saccharum TaxID=4024 RepID=A0AA39TLK5_ACESA|nr:hypothetical protein LWI29_038094 [Acer saccharum]